MSAAKEREMRESQEEEGKEGDFRKGRRDPAVLGSSSVGGATAAVGQWPMGLGKRKTWTW